MLLSGSTPIEIARRSRQTMPEIARGRRGSAGKVARFAKGRLRFRRANAPGCVRPGGAGGGRNAVGGGWFRSGDGSLKRDTGVAIN